MKILIVTWVDPWVRSVSTVHKYVAAGRALGHQVVVYGDPDPELPNLRFTTDLSGVDLALFVIQVTIRIFLGNLLRGEPITIFGDGEQTRDFVCPPTQYKNWRVNTTPKPSSNITVWRPSP